MAKIFWRPEEEQAIALKAGQLMDAKEESFLGNALFRAMELVLDPSRHRPKQSVTSSVSYFRPIVARAMELEKARVENERLQQELAERQEREERERAQNEENARIAEEARRREEDERIERERLEAEEQEEREAEERARQRAAEESQALALRHGQEIHAPDPNRVIQPDFIRQIVSGLATQFEAALVVELTAAAERAHMRVAQTLAAQVRTFEELPKVKPNRPRVVVIGFKAHLNHELYNEFNEFLDLTFFDADARTKEVSNAAAQADHVLLIKKFVPHSLREVTDKHPGFFLVQGSLTAAKEKLMELSIKHDDDSQTS